MRALKGPETESEYRSIIRAEGSEREDALSRNTESAPTLSTQFASGTEGTELRISFLFPAELELRSPVQELLERRGLWPADCSFSDKRWRSDRPRRRRGIGP